MERREARYWVSIAELHIYSEWTKVSASGNLMYSKHIRAKKLSPFFLKNNSYCALLNIINGFHLYNQPMSLHRDRLIRHLEKAMTVSIACISSPEESGNTLLTKICLFILNANSQTLRELVTMRKLHVMKSCYKSSHSCFEIGQNYIMFLFCLF